MHKAPSRDIVREHLRIAMDARDSNALREWAISSSTKSMLGWQTLHEAWSQSENKSMLTWELLYECIELAHEHSLPSETARLSTLHAFACWHNTPEPHWIKQLNQGAAHACIEQAVAWRLTADKGDVYSMQCIQSSVLMQLSIGCGQGQIWKEYAPDLYTYPMNTEPCMEYTEAARCTDKSIYAAAWTFQQMETTRAGWKREMLKRNEMHNLKQVSDTPFVACEYVIEQHAQYDCTESYAQILARSQFSNISELDTWMLGQLASPSGSWDASKCPEPQNRQVQAWWYSLQLGVDDMGLLLLLAQTPPEPVITFALPEHSFTPV